MADGVGHIVADICKRVAEELRLADDELNEVQSKSSQHVYVNNIAWALVHLEIGKAIAKKQDGVYQIAERGTAILATDVNDLTINEARNA